MRKFMLSACTLLALSGLANASDITVEGVNVAHSCLYFSNYAEQIQITYANKDLPSGTAVKLHWGLGGESATQSPSDWTQPYGPYAQNQPGTPPGQDLPMTQISANPPTYQVTLEVNGVERDSSLNYTQFKFTFIQDQPGATYYDRPGYYGYYEADFVNNGPCMNQGQGYPARAPLTVQTKTN